MGFYLGNEPAKVATKVGAGVITAVELADDSITTADIIDDAITPNQLDDDATGFQVGSLGIGTAVSGTDLLKVGGSANITGALAIDGSATFNSTANFQDDVTIGTIDTDLEVQGTLDLTGSLTGTRAIFSSGSPLEFTNNGNTDVYTKTVYYANQNNNSGSYTNGIFVERGRLSNNGSAEIRYFTIGDRGGGRQWSVDGSGNTWQSGSLTGTSASFSGNVKIGSPTASPLTSDYLQIWGDDNATASKEMLRANSSNHGSYRFQLMHDAVDSSDYGGDVRDIVLQGVNVGLHHVAEGSIKFSTYNGGWQRALTIDTSQNATFSGAMFVNNSAITVDKIQKSTLSDGFLRWEYGSGSSRRIWDFRVDTSDKLNFDRYNGSSWSNVYSFDMNGNATFSGAVDSPLVKANDIRAKGSGGISFQNDGGAKVIEVLDNGNAKFYGTTQLYAGSGGNSPPLCFGSETGASKKAIFQESYWMVYQGHNNEGHKFRTVDASGNGTDDLVLTNSSATFSGDVTVGGRTNLNGDIRLSEGVIRSNRGVALSASSSWTNVQNLDGGYQSGLLVFHVWSSGNSASTKCQVFAYNADYYNRTVSSLSTVSGHSSPTSIDVQIVRPDGSTTSDGGGTYTVQAKPSNNSTALSCRLLILSAVS